MNNEKSDRPALKTITQSGVYTLKLCNPKPEKFKLNAAGYPSVWLFFVDPEGNCVSKYYSIQYPKALSILLGKLTGKYVKTLPESSTVEQLIEYVSQGVNSIGAFDIECTPNGEWNGKPQFKYKFKSIEKVIALDNPNKTQRAEQTEAPPF